MIARTSLPIMILAGALVGGGVSAISSLGIFSPVPTAAARWTWMTETSGLRGGTRRTLTPSLPV